MLTDTQILRLKAVKTALLEAEQAHPGSRNLKVLHARMSEAVAEAQSLMTPDQFDELGGGTPKTDP